MKLIEFLLKRKILQKCEPGKQWPGYFNIWIYMDGTELYSQFLFCPIAWIARMIYSLSRVVTYDGDVRIAYLSGSLYQLAEQEEALKKLCQNLVKDNSKDVELTLHQIRVEQLEKALKDARATFVNLSTEEQSPLHNQLRKAANRATYELERRWK